MAKKKNYNNKHQYFHEADNLKHYNEVRKNLGMRLIKPQKRNCLKCNKVFTSYGFGQRLCGCVSEEPYSFEFEG